MPSRTPTCEAHNTVKRQTRENPMKTTIAILITLAFAATGANDLLASVGASETAIELQGDRFEQVNRGSVMRPISEAPQR